KYNREPINPSVIIDGGVGHVYGADFKYQMTEGIDYEIITDSDEVFKGQLPSDAKGSNYTLRIRSKSANIVGDPQNLSYWIDPKDIGEVTGFQLQGVNDGEIEWNGGETRPALVGSTLEETTDYTYDYEYSNKVTTTTLAAVVITGTGNYTGTKRLTYTITPRLFTQEEGSKFTVEASGSGTVGNYKIKLTVKDDARISTQKKLSMETDYELGKLERYNDASREWEEVVSDGGVNFAISNATDEITGLKNAGKYRISLEGRNSYADELVAEAACGTDISKHRAVVKDTVKKYSYTGSDITPSAIGLNDSTGIATGISSANFDVQYERATLANHMLSDVGTIYVIAVGKPEKGYYGRTTRNTGLGGYYEITAPKWTTTNLRVHLVPDDDIPYQPNGGTMIPSVIVTCAGIGLTEGTDYTVSWDPEEVKTAGNNKELILTGINNYADTVNNVWTVLYNITPTDVNSLVETHDEDAHYSGELPSFTLRHNSYKLIAGEDYVANPVYVSGSAIVATSGGFQITYEVTGIGNYTGKRNIVIPISVTDLSKQSFKSKEEAQVGDFYIEWKLSEMVIRDIDHPAQVKPSVFTIVYKDSEERETKLKLDKDYKIIEYGDNNQPGQADNYVKIEGIGGYTGKRQLPITLYANFDGAKPTSTSLLTPGAIISKKKWEEVYSSGGPNGLLELVRLFDDEDNGVINPGEYDMNWSSGFNPADPAVGNYLLRVNGGQRGKHYYYGCVEIPFSIVNGIDDGNTVIALNGESNAIEYDGMPAVVTKGSFIVKIGDVELKRDRDYEIVGYNNNNGIGEATVTLRGIGNYSGEIQHKFKVTYPLEKLVLYLKSDTSEAVRVIDNRNTNINYEYSGMEKLPDVLAYCPAVPGFSNSSNFVSEGAIAISSSYYNVEYRENINAGTAYVIVKPGEYITGTGTRSCMFNIKPASIEPPHVLYSHSGTQYLEYTGDTFTAESLGITLTDNGSVLTNGRNADYIVYYQGDLKNVTPEGSVPQITFLGVNNYTGSHSIPIVISEKSIADSDISGEQIELVYDGNVIEERMLERMKIMMTTSGKKLECGKDFTIVKYYTDSTCTYEVGTINGKPNATETYYIPYNQGTYYVKVKGIGNFKGERVVTVKVEKRPMTEGLQIVFKDSDPQCNGAVVAGEPVCVFNGTAHEPSFDVFYNSEKLDANTYNVVFTNNTDAGTATVEVTAKDGSNYTGTVSRDFVIRPKNINESVTGSAIHFSAIAENYPFDGNSVEPDVIESMTITHALGNSDRILAKDTDYSVSYLSEYDELERYDNKPLHSYAGKVTMTVTGIGNYTGEKKIDFYIGEDISKTYALVNGSKDSYTTYNGLKQAPKETEITVEANGISDLTDAATGEKRYQIAFYKNGIEKENVVKSDEIVDAATYYVAVIGVPSKGTYAKTPADDCKYTIQPKTIANCSVSGFEGMYYYTGSEIRPRGIVVTDTLLPIDDSNRNDTRSVQLTAGIDYTVGYMNNISAGKATIVIDGKGNYTGKVYGYFTIDGSNMSGNQNNDGTSEGTGSLTDGTTTISAEDIELYYDNSQYNYMLYNGGHRVPSIRVAGGTINTNNFYITASNDIYPGVATLTITGTGNNYTGTIVKNYEIKADLSRYGQIVRVDDQVYTGSYVTPNVTVKCGNIVLVPGRDYETTYANNINVGVATVLAQGLASSYYFGTVRGTFNISNKAGGMEISGYSTNYIYSGYAITPEVIVTMDGRLLNKGTDYIVSYRNNINVGTATMTVTGIGSYSGTKEIPFTIQAKNIENCLTTAVDSYSYNGSTYTPNITVTDSTNGKTLVAGTDYTITYSNNTNPGTASITVTALSKNYTGTKVIPFKITSAAVSGLRVSTIKNNRMKLAWTAQSYADGYQICNEKNRVIAMTSNNSYVVKNLNSYTTYKYKVRSYVENSDGSVSYGNFSSAVSAKTLLNTPTLKAKSTSRGKVTLTWSKVSKASGYEIYYSTKRDGIYTKLKTVSKNSARKYVDAGLASGEKYYYTIRAYRTNNGVKTYSNYNTIRAVTVK
ncbi:MAG: fibronectin type III domain-containing protein, partial [bacterium]|nr:fibronectin type III domain-containing protein [bacterium]